MIRIGISLKGYPTKPMVKTLEYESIRIEITELIELIKNGYAFSANFTEEDNVKFSQKERTYKNFISTQILMIDIDDDYECSLEELVNGLKLKPTLAYTTFSHNIKGNRYRLLYIFNNEIKDRYIFKSLYYNILKDNNIKIKDNSGGSAVQCILGSRNDCEIIFNNILYNPNELLTEEQIKCNSNYIKQEEENNIELEMHFSDKELRDDYRDLPYEEILNKYLIKYEYLDHTPIYADEDTPYIILPSNYIEIKRYWFYNVVKDEYENTKYYTKNVKRLKDGEGRKRKLFINGILRRFMIKDMPFEHILINLIYELFFYIDNRFDKITKSILLQIAVNVYKADLSKYEKLNVKTDKRRFIVNGEYCIKYGVSKRTIRNMSKKLITYDAIGNLYDPTLKDKENLKILKENGVDVCLRTLKNFKKDCGLSRTRNKDNDIGSGDNVDIPILLDVPEVIPLCG